jgi:hypothetical protein
MKCEGDVVLFCCVMKKKDKNWLFRYFPGFNEEFRVISRKNIETVKIFSLDLVNNSFSSVATKNKRNDDLNQ